MSHNVKKKHNDTLKGVRSARRQGAAPVVRVAQKNKVVPTEEEESKESVRKGAIFLAVVIIGYIAYLIFSGQMGTFLDALSQVDAYWITVAAFCYLMYFVFGVLAYVIAVILDHESPVGVRDLMSVEASGVFFGNLTPMMAGSVPSQIVRLTRTGIDAGEASATQFTRFIMFQLGVVLFAAIMLAAKFEFFLRMYGDIVFLNLVVFGVHFLELIGLFVICFAPRLVRRVGNWGIRLAERHHWMKNSDHWREVVSVQVQEFSDAFKRAAKDLPSMGLTLFVTMLQLSCLYIIPWFVLHAFDHDADFLECLAAGSMVQMVASAVPLPGGTGGAEGGFALFYGSLFGSAATAGYLVWRIVTFYGPTILAVPLLGIRSNSSVSLYHRWMRLTRRESGSAAVRHVRSSTKRKATINMNKRPSVAGTAGAPRSATPANSPKGGAPAGSSPKHTPEKP